MDTTPICQTEQRELKHHQMGAGHWELRGLESWNPEFGGPQGNGNAYLCISLVEKGQETDTWRIWDKMRLNEAAPPRSRQSSAVYSVTNKGNFRVSQ
jgi:hypothetical protein